MKKIITGFACIVSMICLWGCYRDQGPNPDIDRNLSKLDYEFMTNAAYFNNDELAEADAFVHSFSYYGGSYYSGKMYQFVGIYTKGDLQVLADIFGYKLPLGPDSAHVAFMQHVLSYPSNTKIIDSLYMRGQLDDHVNAINFFQQEISYGTNKNLIGYASKYLPNLIQQKQMADSIIAKIP